MAAFSWAALQPTADRFAGATVAAQAEMVHKILSALVRDEGMYEPTVHVTLDMTLAMAVQRGVMVKSSATYMRQVREAVGERSAWSRYHCLATGDSGESSNAPNLRRQAEAALHLYGETFRLIEPIMLSDRRELAAATAAVVDKGLRLEA